jgi:iron complex transport system substrate-binding protein
MKTRFARLCAAVTLASGVLTAQAAPQTQAASVPAAASARLISTDGFVTELLFSLGADAQLVGVDVTSKLPADYRKLPNIGYHRTLSAEGLLKLRPTQVIGSEFMGPQAVVSALKSAKVGVTQLPMAHTAEQLKSNISTLASLVSQEPKAKKLLAEINSELVQLKHQPLSTMRVAVLLSMDPSKLRLAGSGTSGDAFVQLLQARNVADFKNYQTVSAESLLSLQPDLIVVIGRDKTTAANELMTHSPVLKNTPAGAHSRIVAIDGGALIAGLSPAAISEALAVTKIFSGESAALKSASR